MSTIQSGFSKKTLVAGRGLFEQAILDALVARGSQLKAGAGGFVRSLAKRWPAIVAAMVLAVGVGPTFAEGDDDETPLGAATLIIELTDNDIELQAFIDGSPAWNRFHISDPKERRGHRDKKPEPASDFRHPHRRVSWLRQDDAPQSRPQREARRSGRRSGQRLRIDQY